MHLNDENDHLKEPLYAYNMYTLWYIPNTIFFMAIEYHVQVSPLKLMNEI